MKNLRHLGWFVLILFNGCSISELKRYDLNLIKQKADSVSVMTQLAIAHDSTLKSIVASLKDRMKTSQVGMYHARESIAYLPVEIKKHCRVIEDNYVDIKNTMETLKDSIIKIDINLSNALLLLMALDKEIDSFRQDLRNVRESNKKKANRELKKYWDRLVDKNRRINDVISNITVNGNGIRYIEKKGTATLRRLEILNSNFELEILNTFDTRVKFESARTTLDYATYDYQLTNTYTDSIAVLEKKYLINPKDSNLKFQIVLVTYGYASLLLPTENGISLLPPEAQAKVPQSSDRKSVANNIISEERAKEAGSYFYTALKKKVKSNIIPCSCGFGTKTPDIFYEYKQGDDPDRRVAKSFVHLIAWEK
jgi:hypothetical protein